jgi:soluble lytic murein transglycosylase-like protein
MSSDWQNPCGAAYAWRNLPDGTTEVQGLGLPVWRSSNAQDQAHWNNAVRTWQNWAPEFERAARLNDVPASWLLAIATQETGLWSRSKEEQRTIASQDGYSSIGIMQPIPATAVAMGYTPQDRLDPFKNIDIGARLLAKNIGLYGRDLIKIGAAFNRGKFECLPGREPYFNTRVHQGSNYPFNIIRTANTAIATGLVKPSRSLASSMGLGLLIAGAGALTAIAIMRSPKRLAA